MTYLLINRAALMVGYIKPSCTQYGQNNEFLAIPSAILLYDASHLYSQTSSFL